MSELESLSLLPNTTARDNWARYLYVRNRGHDSYCRHARILEQMYLGQGSNSTYEGYGSSASTSDFGQWTPEDRDSITDGRILHEFNEIAPAINAAIGYQIHNRMDISFKPRSGMADEDLAAIRSKIAMQIADNNGLHYKETDVFTDGLIEQRGYFEVRISYEDSILGELTIDVLDPRDVIPDPDGKTQNPDDWADVTITRWMSLDTIEQRFGQKLRDEIESFRPYETDFGSDDTSVERSRFGDNQSLGSNSEYDAWRIDNGIINIRIIDRQKHIYEDRKVAIYPTGDIRQIIKLESIPELEASGVMIQTRKVKIVKRTVTTKDLVLFEGDGDFPFISIIPYFPYFRRGKTRSMVDYGMDAQRVYNKMITQFVHIVNSVSNSGWTVEEKSLTNMDTEDLEQIGAATGLVIEYKTGSAPPQKIQPNQVPQGVTQMLEISQGAVRDSTIPEAMRGTQGQEISGVAIQSKQFASQQQMAIILDNLSRTRALLAKRIDWVITNIYDSARIFRITGTDKQSGRKITEEVAINIPIENGMYHNDMTVGEYDVVISEQPMQTTFENTQFTQALEMRDKGVRIDDKTIIRYSNLADKHDIIDNMDKQSEQVDPEKQANAALLNAKAQREAILAEKDKAGIDNVKADTESKKSETVKANVDLMFASTEAAVNLLQYPGAIPTADVMLQSAGFIPVETGVSPNFEQAQVQGMQLQPSQPVPQNTHPLFPANPQQPDIIEPQIQPMTQQQIESPMQGATTIRTEPL